MRRVMLAIALAAAAACSSDAAPTPATTSTTVPAAGGDLRHLAAQIVALHPDPFHHLDRAELEARTIDDPSDPDQLLVAAMRLANLGVGEGHGGVYPWAQPALEAWPLHLYDDGGIRIVGGTTDVSLGSRVVAIGDTPIDEVVERVHPLVPHDNEWTIRARLPAYLVFPAVLRGVGIDPSTLTWEVDGRTITVPAPTTVTSAELADLLGLFQPQVPPSPPYDHGRRFSVDRRGDAVVVEWNQVQSTDGDLSLSELASALVADVASGEVTSILVDATHNPGGDINRATPLVLAVTEIERSRPGTVTFKVGRSTFSAASHVIANLVAEVGVAVTGEPTGGNQRSYADPRRVELPTSGIVAFVNTREYVSGDGSWGPVVAGNDDGDIGG